MASKKTVIVTGASQGIGAAVVQAFLDRGYNVVATSRSVSKAGFTPSPHLALVDGDIGQAATAEKVAQTAIGKFGSINHIVNNAGIFAAKCYEFSDFLVTKLGVTDLGARFPAKVTFHDGCHGLRELGNKKPPRQLLSRVQGLELVEMADVETCCGFGGTFAAKFPMISTAMGDVKCAAALDTGAEYIVSNDSSCLMHLQGLLDRQGKKLKTIHLAEVLAQS